MFYEIDAAGDPVHYSPYNGEVLPGYMFTDTGFWDTFRSLFPFLNLLYPSINEKMQAGLANAYRESGFLPEWASPGHRGCMVGNNSASVVADAYLRVWIVVTSILFGKLSSVGHVRFIPMLRRPDDSVMSIIMSWVMFLIM